LAGRGGFGSDAQFDTFAQGPEDALSALDGDTAVLVAFVARDDGLVDAEAVGQVALLDAVGDAQVDEQQADVLQLMALPACATLAYLTSNHIVSSGSCRSRDRIAGPG